MEWEGERMKVLKKILEEIEEATFQEDPPVYVGNTEVDGYVLASRVKEIICSHMDDVPDNNWIPVEERLPEPDKMAVVTVHCSEWISDYDSVWVPENEKIHHDEEYLVRMGYMDKDGDWIFHDQDGCEFYCEKEFGADKTDVYNVVTAWQPLPEAYKGGE